MKIISFVVKNNDAPQVALSLTSFDRMKMGSGPHGEDIFFRIEVDPSTENDFN